MCVRLPLAAWAAGLLVGHPQMGRPLTCYLAPQKQELMDRRHCRAPCVLATERTRSRQPALPCPGGSARQAQ